MSFSFLKKPFFSIFVEFRRPFVLGDLLVIHYAGLPPYLSFLLALCVKLVSCPVTGVFYLTSSTIQSSDLPHTWIFQSCVVWGFVHFTFDSWSVLKKDHLADWQSFANILAAIGRSWGSCFATSFSTVSTVVFVLRNLPQLSLFLQPFLAPLAHR